MGEMEEPTRISILGQENIVVHYDIWGSYIIEDLLHNVSNFLSIPYPFLKVSRCLNVC